MLHTWVPRLSSKVLHETTADTGSDSMFIALIILYKNYFVFLIFASLAMRENILTAKISRFTVHVHVHTRVPTSTYPVRFSHTKHIHYSCRAQTGMYE